MFDQLDRADEEEEGVKRSKSDLHWLCARALTRTHASTQTPNSHWLGTESE
jgi:hypothetical protein